MKRIGRAFLVVIVILGLSVVWGYAQRPIRDSAWERLVTADPSAADDPAIGWRERLILFALTPEQAEAYFKQGADPRSLLLEDGRTLEEYLDAKLSPPASVFIPLAVPCQLFASEGIEANQVYRIQVRGNSLDYQGGSAAGCGIPEQATAVILQLRIENAAEPGRIKLWAADGPEPGEAVLETAAGEIGIRQTESVVRLATNGAGGRDLELSSSGTTNVRGVVVGYFRKPRTGIGSGGDIAFYTEGSSNNFFGTGAGVNTTGSNNSFFGAWAGNSNSSGSGNSFFGGSAGNANTTGYENAFFGYEAGGSNLTAHNNACFGAWAGYFNTHGSDNAFFGYEAGYTNTASSNSFFGYRAGLSNLTGHSNTFVGCHAGHHNTSGYFNSIFGDDAGYGNTTGFYNSFFGRSAGRSNTTGNLNSFFGKSAGYSNTTGYRNAFFGEEAGYFDTTGHHNSFYGTGAGLFVTTGSANAFFGEASGVSNTVEDGNTFLGALSNLTPGPDPDTSPVTNATALGYRAKVSQSNSLILGSIDGVNGATADVKVGIGTTAPQETLHVVRSDGSAMIKVEETSGTTANRVLFRLTNNGAPWFKLLNSNSGQEWTFAMDQFDNFIFSRIGTGGAEFKIYQSGEVTMGPGGSEVFDLQPSGDLEITGGLTAGGVYYASDRNLKENFTGVDTRQVLEKVAALDITRWNYRSDQGQTLHLGPMAQDFHAAFGVGNDDKTISASDISGVALAAIQGLYQQTRRELAEKDRQLAAQQAEIQALKSKLSEMETLKQAVAALQARLPGSGTAPQAGAATD